MEKDLSRVCLVDNSPISYRVNEGQLTVLHAFAEKTADLPYVLSSSFVLFLRSLLALRLDL